MNALPTRIPRAFANHRTKVGAAYRLIVQAKLARLGTLPADARPVLRDSGRLAVELDLSMRHPTKPPTQRIAPTSSTRSTCRISAT